MELLPCRTTTLRCSAGGPARHSVRPCPAAQAATFFVHAAEPELHLSSSSLFSQWAPQRAAQLSERTVPAYRVLCTLPCTELRPRRMRNSPSKGGHTKQDCLRFLPSPSRPPLLFHTPACPFPPLLFTQAPYVSPQNPFPAQPAFETASAGLGEGARSQTVHAMEGKRTAAHFCSSRVNRRSRRLFSLSLSFWPRISLVSLPFVKHAPVRTAQSDSVTRKREREKSRRLRRLTRLLQK